jgi:hypothetical protein
LCFPSKASYSGNAAGGIDNHSRNADNSIDCRAMDVRNDFAIGDRFNQAQAEQWIGFAVRNYCGV